tara:strand:+ start:428 stop:676 length:249 start_codon:yes stop_codon:yes gene_type:complete
MKTRLQKLFKKHGTHLFNLKDRWSDEKEFEDIEDYGKEIAKIFKRYGYTDTSVTRAFMIKTNLEGRKLKVKMYQSGRVVAIG